MNSGCLGIHCKSKLITSISEPLKRPKLQEQKASKLSISEDFWTTNTCEMDNSAVQSQGSISSISTSTLTVDPHGTSSLLLWNQTRLQWIGNKKSENQAQQLREPKLSWNATYESLLGSNKPFRRPIPLPEMVDFLVDIWEQDGLYN
ncbi:hypothetical protein CsSME_00007503 [Camellia sinensis var. sinensis]